MVFVFFVPSNAMRPIKKLLESRVRFSFSRLVFVIGTLRQNMNYEFPARFNQFGYLATLFCLHSPGRQHTPNGREIRRPQIIEIAISPEQ